MANGLLSKQIPDAFAGLLYPDPSVNRRGMLLPFLKRTVTDPIDDVSEYEQTEFAMPSLLYDPLQGLAGMGQMLRGERPVDPREITKTALDIGMLSAPVGLLGGVPKGAVLGANVFHGTPHRFAPEPDFPLGRPRLDKVGTGEGAQAYGHGFYSAESKAVGQDYYNAFKDNVSLHFKDKPIDEIWDEGIKKRWADEISGMSESQINDFTTIMSNLTQVNNINDIKNVLHSFTPRQKHMYRELVEPEIVKPTPNAFLYKLDIPDADVAKYLDYDAPLSEQPKHIQKAWAEFKKSELGVLADESLHGTISAGRGQFNNPTGKNIYGAFVEGAASKVGSDKWAEKADYKLANEVLRKAGISGLKYRDQMSRYDPDILPDNMIANEARKWLGQSDGNSKKAMKLFKDSNPRELYANSEINEIEKVINTAGRKITRNYVTWDQDVLNRSKMLERDGVALTADKAPTDTPSGLLDDTASRMQRAQDMGFDVDLTRYHQTSPAAKKEIMKGGFDPSIIGARWSDPLMPDGVFMKSGKDKLAGLTQGKQTQMPLMTRAQNTKAFQNRGELETFLSKDKQWKKMRDKQTALQDDATKLYQAVDTGKITEKDALVNLFGFDPKEVNKLDDVEVFDAFDGVIRDMAGTTSAELRARATEVFKKKGFDSVSVAEDWGGPFGKTVTDTFIVFDEKMLRSPKAKFDPAKAGSADLLAANPPTAGILGLLSQQNNEN